MTEIVELLLSNEQRDLIAPIVRAHVASGRNTAFIATCAPDLNAWRFQVVGVSRSVGQKLLRVIREDTKKIQAREKEYSEQKQKATSEEEPVRG
jgi:hypothetical protein